jgi:hypothetical protein
MNGPKSTRHKKKKVTLGHHVILLISIKTVKTQDTIIKTIRSVTPWGHNVTLLHTTLYCVL